MLNKTLDILIVSKRYKKNKDFIKIFRAIEKSNVIPHINCAFHSIN